jgi:hypothetical protein
MNSGRLALGVCVTAAAMLASCGSPGVPEPPSLELARPVRDLKAFRKGSQVHLTWSVSAETTDHQTFRHAGPTQICRSLGEALRVCGTPIAEVATPVATSTHNRRRKKSSATAAAQAGYTDQLSAALESQSPTSELSYAMSVLNSYGKSAGLSNQVQVPSAPTLPAPANLDAHLVAEGVRLIWSPVPPPHEIPGLRFAYRVYRRDAATNRDSIAGEVPVTGETHPVFVDTNLVWEKIYDYHVTVVTFVEQANASQQVEGYDTASVRVDAHDIFPPAIPSGLQAAFSGPDQKPFIDLVWNANAEPDFAGYNVYRHELNRAPVKINSELVKLPAFRDSDVIAGQEYFYSVSAVDVRGNESPHSEEASETVPPAAQ